MSYMYEWLKKVFLKFQANFGHLLLSKMGKFVSLELFISKVMSMMIHNDFTMYVSSIYQEFIKSTNTESTNSYITENDIIAAAHKKINKMTSGADNFRNFIVKDSGQIARYYI